MLEESAEALATIDLEYALACFEVDRWGAVKKIPDVNFDHLLATSTCKVKKMTTYQVQTNQPVKTWKLPIRTTRC